MLKKANDSLEKVARCMTKYADLKKRPIEFDIGDQVFLKLTRQIWKWIRSKNA